MADPKKNEIRTVVIVVILLIVFLLIRRESHFTYRHPISLSGMVCQFFDGSNFKTSLATRNDWLSV
jgi:hypothetical protein